MRMPAIEERLSVVEKELAQIKEQMATDHLQPTSHSWDHVFGSLANSKGFDEAVRLGREYRESLRPKDEDTV
jgi:hypothetical protein